jgi:signal transduction histidine kinase
VRHRGQLLGRLVLRERIGEPLTPLEEKLFADLASAAGLVLRNVGLTAELRDQVAEVARRAEELRASRERIVAAHDDARRRLERDIHDGAQQHLVALSVNLRLVRTLAERDADRARTALPDLRAASVATVETLRELARGLHPRLLAETGLVGALRAVAERSPVPVELRDRNVGRYPAELEAAVYFCCLEALQNAAKHSAARHVVISLAGGAELSLEVADDGAGFRPADVEAASGLANMRDRLEAVGGTLEVVSEPGRGTTVRARVVVADLPVARDVS